MNLAHSALHSANRKTVAFGNLSKGLFPLYILLV